MGASESVRGLPGEHIVSVSADAAARLLAARLADHLRQRLAVVSSAHLALSGGSSATLLGAALAELVPLSDSEWSRIHLWMVDERCVGPDDPRLNANLIREAVIARIPLPTANLHPMPVLQPDGADRYEADLRAALAGRPSSDRRLDAVVLGMGPDGHTASLFPGSAALDERERLVTWNDGDRVTPPRPRMTMTYPLLSGAHLIALLVTGVSKQRALRQATQRPLDFRTLPVVGVVPAPDSRLLWFLDRDAAGDDTSATPVSG
ncbi:MAG TPA: 6-phosphogluconolactonase [Polyangia bacterium]